MSKRYYRDIYGATASIEEHRDGSATLRAQAGLARTVKRYSSSKGARIAMGRMSDGWREVAA